MPEFNGFSHLAVTVSDVERSKAWYTDVLGWQSLMEGVDDSNGIAYAVGIVSGGVAVSLRQHPGGSGEAFSPARIGLDHASFSVAGREDLEAWASHLAAKGAVHSGVVEAPYGLVLSFKDPDGIALEAFVLAAR